MDRFEEVKARRAAAVEGLTETEARAAAAESTYMLNTEPGWRPSDALARAADKIRKGQHGRIYSRTARGMLGLPND